MNHASLGYLNAVGELVIEEELLNSLCLGIDSQLFGIYYPSTPPNKNKEYQGVEHKHDLMLTPIPFRFWPVSARIHIYLKNIPGGLSVITTYFRKRNISIIHGEASRSAFRYGTWSLHIAFEDVLNEARSKPLVYDREHNYFLETYRALKDLLKEMRKDSSLKQVLFAPDYFKKVDGTVNAPLAYFTNFYKNLEDNTWLADKSIVQPFTLTLKRRDNSFALQGDSQFKIVIEHLKATQKNKSFLPAIAFSELDTRSLNIRTALITLKDSKRFFKVGIEYNRINPEDNSCIGILHSIIGNLNKYNIWQTYNYTIESSKNNETGHFVFIVEERATDTMSRDFKERIYVETAQQYFEAVVAASENQFDNVSFGPPIVIPLPKPPVLERLLKKNKSESLFSNPNPDVFISYSHADKKWVDEFLNKFHDLGLTYMIDREFIHFGDNISNSILSRIIACREICVILSDDSMTSQWVARERGAAWVLGKRVTTIMLTENVPASEREKLYVRGKDTKEIEDYLHGIMERKDEELAEKFKNIFER